MFSFSADTSAVSSVYKIKTSRIYLFIGAKIISKQESRNIMKSDYKNEIYEFCMSNNINIFDIKGIQTVALKHKKYDLVIYLNKNLQEYLSYANQLRLYEIPKE